MDVDKVVSWITQLLQHEGCVYQDDVVDFVVRAKAENLLRENADGNLVLGRSILAAFKAETESTVVWVKPDRYWRWRVLEDESGRDARG